VRISWFQNLGLYQFPQLLAYLYGELMPFIVIQMVLRSPVAGCLQVMRE